jgi:hypothetical protein
MSQESQLDIHKEAEPLSDPQTDGISKRRSHHQHHPHHHLVLINNHLVLQMLF